MSRPVALVLVCTVLTACTGVGNPATNSTASSTTSSTLAPTTTEAGAIPSQTPSDAERDGVIPELAAIPVAMRVDVQLAIPAEEGLWVVSRPHPDIIDLAPGCRLGNPKGVHGIDNICVAEYGEVLLMDAEGQRILRAYPLPGLPPQLLEITDDAVFCARQGDGALPASMVCRIDRSTLEWTAHVYPWIDDSGFGENREVPANWVVEDPVDAAYFEHLKSGADRVTVSGWGGTLVLDPETLETLS